MSSPAKKATIFGLAFLSAIAPLKFTQPVILWHLLEWPTDLLGWIYFAWPNTLLNVAVFLLAIVVLATGLWRRISTAVWFLPAFFVISQFLAALGTVDPDLTRNVLYLLTVLILGFFLGAAAVRDESDVKLLLSGWMIGICLVILLGYQQANGGLEETRRFMEANPIYGVNNPALLAKIQSPRIFSSFVYPNALGGFAASAVFVVGAWYFSMRRSAASSPQASGMFLVFTALAITSVLGLMYCIWQAASKGGYAVLVAGVILAIWMLMPRRKQAFGVIFLAIVISIGGFALGFGHKGVEKGKKTLDARMGYWRAAWKIGRDHPLLGTGPGTFSRLYVSYKKWGDEETRLVHNNYLQMWSDSGLLGFAGFLVFLPGSLILWWRRWRKTPPAIRIVPTLLWCACMVFALHSLIDFDLYMASNSWPIFVLLGYLANGRTGEGDRR